MVKLGATTSPVKVMVDAPSRLAPVMVITVPAGPLVGETLKMTGSTRKGAKSLESVALGVTTSILPVVAPGGTVVVIWVGDTTVKLTGVPLKLTLVAPVRFVPRILIVVPVTAAGGNALTNGRSPAENLKIVP